MRSNLIACSNADAFAECGPSNNRLRRGSDKPQRPARPFFCCSLVQSVLKSTVKGSLQCRKLSLNLEIVLSQLIPHGGTDVAIAAKLFIPSSF